MDSLISRQDAINAILADKIDAISLKVMTALGDGKLALTLNDACDRHIRDIEKLPSAEPERKTGKWIRITQGAMPEQYICPFCHRIVESYGVEELLSICYPYCHCGADLRGD